MRITEAAHYLGISINTLKEMADIGRIKSYKTTGGHRRFKREALDSFMGVEVNENDITIPKNEIQNLPF